MPPWGGNTPNNLTTRGYTELSHRSPPARQGTLAHAASTHPPNRLGEFLRRCGAAAGGNIPPLRLVPAP
eukprot:291241-Pyramimonas_sp.AAC.1